MLSSSSWRTTAAAGARPAAASTHQDGGAAAHAAAVLAPADGVVLLALQRQHHHAQQAPALAREACGRGARRGGGGGAWAARPGGDGSGQGGAGRTDLAPPGGPVLQVLRLNLHPLLRSGGGVGRAGAMKRRLRRRGRGSTVLLRPLPGAQPRPKQALQRRACMLRPWPQHSSLNSWPQSAATAAQSSNDAHGRTTTCGRGAAGGANVLVVASMAAGGVGGPGRSTRVHGRGRARRRRAAGGGASAQQRRRRRLTGSCRWAAGGAADGPRGRTPLA